MTLKLKNKNFSKQDFEYFICYKDNSELVYNKKYL